MKFSEDILTIILCIIMLAVGLYFYVIPFLKKVKDNPTEDYDEPQAIASLGVLFTFIGIAYSLWNFNSADIEASVPDLLIGMRTAFWTSVIGMSSSMILKYYQNQKAMQYYKQQVKIDTDATIGELITYLKDRDKKNTKQEDLNRQYQQNLIKSIQEINKSLVGDGDASVITQVQLIKSKIQDGFERSNQQAKEEHREMITEFRDFAKTMAENNSKAFIEALNNTIHDFNEKIQEQFGENFKQLNIAVGKLLAWQEAYKNTVIEVTENQKVIFAGINDAKVSLAEMAVHGDSIKDSAKQLGDILITIDKYQKELEQSLEDLREIGSSAKEMVPHIKLLAEETCGGINSISKVTNTNLENNTTLAIGQVEQFYEKVGEEIIASSKKMEDSYISVAEKMQMAGSEITELGEQTMVAIQNNGDNIEQVSVQSVKAVDAQMKEISKALNETVTEMLKLISAYEKEIENSSKKSIDVIKAAADKLQNSALEVTQRVSDNLAKISEDNNSELKQQQKNMAKSFEDIMSKALYAFGNEMVKISQKFAEDYVPLADRLRDILRIAEQAQRRGNRG